MAKVTLQTIADQLGVSRMTVSNAFSRPDQLSSALRERILSTAEELGYVGPDPAGRALARGSTGAVGVLLTDSLEEAFTDAVATAFLSAIVEEMAPTGLALTLLTAGDQGDVVPARDVALDGALVYSCYPESTARDWLMRRKLPLVFVDQDPEPDIPSVNVDDESGAAAGAEHLLSLGHRRIGILTRSIDGTEGVMVDPEASPQGHPQRRRLDGWLGALREASVDPVVAHVPASTEASARAGAHSLLGVVPRPTAVLCFSDVIALALIDVAAELGLSVPADLSVVGFDDNPVATQRQPALTTVRQDVAVKGHLAAQELTAIIERSRNDTADRARHHLLPTELVVRESTGPPPANGLP